MANGAESVSRHRWGIAAAALLAGAPTLYGFGVRMQLRRAIAELRRGNLEPLLRGFSDDVHFVFPGESSWKTDVRGREEVERWERRFLDTGLELEPLEILVGGPPWNTRIAIHFEDSLTTADGRLAYENAGVIFGTVRWGRVTSYTVYEDTQKLGPLDEHLAAATSSAG